MCDVSGKALSEIEMSKIFPQSYFRVKGIANFVEAVVPRMSQ